MRKFQIKIAIFLLLSSCLSYSQSFQWLQNGGGNNTLSGSNFYQKEQVLDMAADSQRNVYVISIIGKDGAMVNGNAITTYESHPNDNDFIVTSYACDGSYRWHKIFLGG